MTDKVEQARELLEKIRSECEYLENEMRSQCDQLETALDDIADREQWDEAVADTVDGCQTGLGGQISLIDAHIQDLTRVVHEIDAEQKVEA